MADFGWGRCRLFEANWAAVERCCGDLVLIVWWFRLRVPILPNNENRV
jgi:hypothetical protein